MANLKLSSNYYSVLYDMANYAIQDRMALIDAHYTQEVGFYDRGSRYPDAEQAFKAYSEIKTEVEIEIADFEKIKLYAQARLQGATHA
jgi:hypothetical protein